MTRIPLPLVAVCMYVAVACLSSRADANTTVVVIAGTAPDHDGSQVRTAVEAAIRDSGWTVSPRPLAKKDAAAVLECKDAREPWTCVAMPASTLGVGSVVILTVDRKPSEGGAPMTVLVGQLVVIDSQVAAAASRTCEQCADDKLSTAATELTNELLRGFLIRSGKTTIDLRTTPTGAQITLDGSAAGASDQVFKTYPGRHVIAIAHPGFQNLTETVTVAEGQTLPVVRTLKPIAVAVVPPPLVVAAHHRSRLVPAIAIGVGAVMLIGGTAYSMSVDGPRSGPQDEYLYSGPAIGVAVVGALAIGAGIYLWPRGHDAPVSSPTASLTNGGATAGWIKSF